MPYERAAVPASGRAPWQMPTSRRIVGIGEFAVSQTPDDLIVTHALGSCIAVCVWDPVVRVGGLLHFLLPDSKVNLARAQKQPATFADTGIPLLFQTAYARGMDKRRCQVHLVGGAEVAGLQGPAALNVGKRNLLVARQILWQNGVLVKGESTGGTIARTVVLRVVDGLVDVTSGREAVAQL